MKLVKPFGIMIAAFFVVILLAGRGNTFKSATEYLPPLENSKALCRNKDTGRVRSQITIVMQKIIRNNDPAFIITKKGKGAYAGFENVVWRKEAELIEENGLLKTLASRTIIRNTDNVILSGNEKTYDYDRGLINFRQYGRDNVLIREQSFKIKGYTCDDITFGVCLRAYAANLSQPPFKHFYLLTDEPRYYKTNIRVVENKSLHLSSGNMPTIRLKLTGDVGILENILDRFVPPTYLWFEKDDPFRWLKYQGFEIGQKSAYITMQSQP